MWVRYLDFAPCDSKSPHLGVELVHVLVLILGRKIIRAMMKPFFSIIIPVYNVAPYLRECLDSILQQRCDGVEIIAVNDCSPDGSLEILKEYEQNNENVKVLNFVENKGVSAARNAGLEECSGEWVLFMDSDDALVPGALCTIKKSIDSEQCDIVTYDFAYVDDIRADVKGNVCSTTVCLDMQDANVATRYFKRVFPHKLWAWNKCIKRSIIGNLRFRDFQPCEDAIFTLECIFRANKILELSDALYKYVQHEGSCMRTITAKRINGDINGLRSFCDVINAWQHRLLVRRFAKRQLERCFLEGIPRGIRQLRSIDDKHVGLLTEQFFDAAIHVFIESNMCCGLEKAMYRNLLSNRSLGRLESYLKILARIRSILSLPRRGYRRLACMISGDKRSVK